MEDEWYECPTCCYATNIYAKWLKHGQEHIERTEVCRHSNIICNKAEGVYRCRDCQAVVGHFMTVAESEKLEAENGR